MTKQIHPETDVTILGKSYTLIFPYSALAKFCDFLNIPANSLQARLSPEKIMLSDLPVLLWAGLQKLHKTPYQDVEDMIDQMKSKDIQDLFAKAQSGMSAAFVDDARAAPALADAEDEDAGNDQTTPKATG